MKDNLTEIVEKLIYSKREDDYWDFKLQHHENKADLLLDIICMANNLTSSNGYIIFGIDDTTFELIGVKNDEHRRSQQEIIDFLSSKDFFMNNRPKVELKEILIDGIVIDVLTIINTLNTPYYLTKNYKKVNSGNIYTRIGDTNTPVNKTADPIYIEYLWKKRFGLHLSHLEKFLLLLESKQDWNFHEDYWDSYSSYYYNIHYPEYTIIFTDDPRADSLEFYSYLMMNKSTKYQYLEVKYHSTTIYYSQLVLLDAGRFSSLVPSWEFVSSPFNSYDSFKYFIKNSIEDKINIFLFDENNEEESYAKRRLDECILYFNSEDEKNSFINYYNLSIKNDKKYYDNLKSNFGDFKYVIDNDDINEDIHFSLSLKNLLDKFKSSP